MQSLDERMGTVLRQLREARGWSLSYVAEICETSAANLSKIERGGAREYTLELLTKMGAAYGLRAYELMARVEAVEVAPDTLSDEEQALLSAYRSLSQEQKGVLASVAMTLRPPGTIALSRASRR